MKSILIIITVFTFSKCTSSKQGDNNYLGNDVRLFENTPVWEIAQAIEKDDTDKVRKLLLNKPKEFIDYKENKFGQSLLNWAVYANHYSSVVVLAELGANPNQKANDSTSAFIQAANHHETSDYLKILLNHGGDVNSVANINAPQHLRTPLIAAAKSLDNVKLLIKAGANPNYIYNASGMIQSALVYAFYSDNIDIIKYLIIDVGVNCKNATGVTIDGDSLYVNDDLRLLPYPLDSPEYKKKMEVVDFLKKQGIDYWKTPIPKHYLKLYDKEYLEKY
jgi:ankyrin repeat protein